jgi:hypothetical protein
MLFTDDYAEQSCDRRALGLSITGQSVFRTGLGKVAAGRGSRVARGRSSIIA